MTMANRRASQRKAQGKAAGQAHAERERHKAHGSPSMLFWTAIVIVLADIITKTIVRTILPVNQYIPVLPFFRITHFQNQGITFGLFQYDILRWLLVAVALGVALAIGLSCKHHKLKSHLMAWGLIMGGAIGNAVDRIFIGTVTDFLHFGIPNTNLFWPAFNIADASLVIGAIIIILHAWRKEE